VCVDLQLENEKKSLKIIKFCVFVVCSTPLVAVCVDGDERAVG